MLPNFIVKNVTIDAQRNIYGTNTAQPKSIIGNAKQRLKKQQKYLLVTYVANHTSSGLGYGDIKKNVFLAKEANHIL
jgi:hypothetical protein